METIYMAAAYMAEPPIWRVISWDTSLFEAHNHDHVYGGTAYMAAISVGQTPAKYAVPTVHRHLG